MIQQLVGPQLIAPLVQKVVDGAISLCDNVTANIKQSLKEDIKDYIGNISDKFSSIKTFLYNDERLPFYDVYFPLSLKKANKRIKVPQEPEDLFDNGNCVTLLGHAGCGKTMILRHLFLASCQHGDKIPLVIELRKLKDTSGKLNEFIADKVFRFQLSQNENIYKWMLKSGKFFFLFDGYDEIAFSQKDLITHDLEEFVDNFPGNYYLLTSRPGAGAESLERFENYHVCGLSNEQVMRFIDKQLQVASSDEGQEQANRIKYVLQEAENKAYMKYMRSPLLLSMFILTYNEHPELPHRKSSFYYNVFDTLHSKHDARSKSGGFQHEKKTKLSQDDIRKVLEAFCFISYLQSTYEFTSEYLHDILPKVLSITKIDCNIDDFIFDLSVGVSLFVQDGTSYVFPHRSLQEYFAASYIANSREEAKKGIYSKLSTYDSIEVMTFWELCEELDKSCFLQYFVIPNLEKYINELVYIKDKRYSRSANILLNYMKKTEIAVCQNEEDSFLVIEHIPFEKNLMRYFHIEFSPTQNFFSTFRSAGKEALKVFMSGNNFEFQYDNRNAEVIKFYETHGLFNDAEEYVAKLQEKLGEEKALLKEMKQDALALMKLV